MNLSALVQKLEENNLRMFLQKEDHTNDVRYALVLDSNDNGLVYGYEGGGIYSECLVKKRNLFNLDSDEECVEFDDQVAQWNEETQGDYETISDCLFGLGEYGDCNSITLDPSILELFEGDKVAVTFGEINPVDYCNTYWR